VGFERVFSKALDLETLAPEWKDKLAKRLSIKSD
jgi:hypothetical protein